MKQRDTTLESWQKAFYGFHRLTLLEDGGPTGPGPGGPEEGWPTGYMVTLKRVEKRLAHLVYHICFHCKILRLAYSKWRQKYGP